MKILTEVLALLNLLAAVFHVLDGKYDRATLNVALAILMVVI